MIFVEESLNSRKRSDPVSFCFVNFVLFGFFSFWKFDQIWCNLKEIDFHGEILVLSKTLRKNLEIEWNWRWFFFQAKSKNLGGQVVKRCNMPVEIIKLLGISNDFWWKLGLNLISKKIACISLVEILKLVRISLKNKNESHVCTLCTYFIYDSHFTTFSLGHCPKSRYIHFGKRVNYNLGRLVNFGIKTENPS